jgi:hypothetical protein
MSRRSARRAENPPSPPWDLRNDPSYRSIGSLERALTLQLSPQNILNISELITLYRHKVEMWETALAKAPSDEAFLALLVLAGLLDPPRADRMREGVRSMRDNKKISAARIVWFKDRKERLEKVMHDASLNRPEDFRAHMQDVIPSFWVSALKIPRLPPLPTTS